MRLAWVSWSGSANAAQAYARSEPSALLRDQIDYMIGDEGEQATI